MYHQTKTGVNAEMRCYISKLVVRRCGNASTGTTIMEVLFAIGIVMVGLVGIASLIPLAIRQASDSRVLTQSTSMAQNAYRGFVANDMYAPTSELPWLISQDTDVNSLTGIASYGQPSNYYSQWDTPAFIPVRSFKELVYFQAGLEQTNFTSLVDAAGYGARHSYCIDPLMWASQPTIAMKPVALGSEANYRRSRFPYYVESHNPLSNPSNPEFPYVADNNPRMIRVSFPEIDTISGVIGLPSTGIRPNFPMRSKMAQRLFTTDDDIAYITSEKDRSLSGVRTFSSVPSSGQQLAQAASNQDISWFATLTPLEQDTVYAQNLYNLSIVMFNKRDRTFEAPVIGSASPIDTSNLPTTEIVATAVPNIDLVGGNPVGGTAPLNKEYAVTGANSFGVDLYGYAGPGVIDSSGELRREIKIKVGSWVMLSRRFYFSSTVNAAHDRARSKDIFKWYRVAGVGANPEIISQVDAYGNTMTEKVWRQRVQLVGPDWMFRDLSDGLKLPTTATYVPNVVSVYERIVQMPIE